MLVIVATTILVIGTGLTAIVYEAPSCTDNKQNQGEVGVDCGGSCPYLCTTQVTQPTVLYALPLRNGAGRTDLIARIENKNQNAAAKNVPYSVKLYTTNLAFVREVTGTVDLPPRTSVPIFIPGIAVGSEVVRTSFSIDPVAPKWFTLANDSRVVPTVANSKLLGTPSAPRVEASVMNTSIQSLANVRAIVLVHGTSGNVIAASETVLSSVPAQGQVTALFTWDEAFSGIPSLIEVVPVIPLP